MERGLGKEEEKEKKHEKEESFDRERKKLKNYPKSNDITSHLGIGLRWSI